MNSVRITSIRANLVWLVAACMLPVVLAASALLYFHYDRERSELTHESAAKIRALSYTLDREILGIQTVLIALASSPHLMTGNLVAFDLQARDVVRGARVTSVLLTDLQGQQLTNTRQAIGAPLPTFGAVELLERVIQTQQPVVSDLFIGKLLKAPLISIGIPVKRGDTLLYVLTASILPEQIGRVLAQQEFAEGQVVGVLDRLGVEVARNGPVDKPISQGTVFELLKKSVAIDHGHLATESPDGRSALFVYRKSATTGWLLYTALAHDRLHRDLSLTLWWLVTVTALAMAVGLGMARYIGGRISAAIGALKLPALALGEGRHLEVPPLPIREVHEIGTAMGMASRMLATATGALHSSEARMRNILESATDAIITVDESKNIVLFNAAAARMFECPVPDAVGAALSRFIPLDSEAIWNTPADTPVRPQQPGERASIAAGLRRGGEQFPLEISCSSVVESGAVFYTLIIRDVTARERAYALLVRSNLDLQQFAYVASHDLKTPLRSISGFVQLLSRNYSHQLDEKAIELISRTASAAQRLEHLTDDLLAYARVSSEARTFAPVCCNEVALEVVHLLDAAAASSGAVVNLGELPVVMGDRTQLVQLLLNLIGNSIKYCQGRTPVIHVSAREDERDWIFSVADNGIGIDVKHHEKIFEVFKRLHTQQQYAGTGIGLAVCKRVVERHGGKIWITSTVGEGSTFTFSLAKKPLERTST